MKTETIINNNFVESMKSGMTKAKMTAGRYLSRAYGREFLTSIQPYAKSAAILAITTIFFKVITSPLNFISQNPLLSAAVSFTVGGVAGLVSTSYNDRVEKVTVIGIGLLVNHILVPTCLPTYSLPTIATISINLIGASIGSGNSIRR